MSSNDRKPHESLDSLKSKMGDIRKWGITPSVYRLGKKLSVVDTQIDRRFVPLSFDLSNPSTGLDKALRSVAHLNVGGIVRPTFDLENKILVELTMCDAPEVTLSFCFLGKDGEYWPRPILNIPDEIQYGLLIMLERIHADPEVALKCEKVIVLTIDKINKSIVNTEWTNVSFKNHPKFNSSCELFPEGRELDEYYMGLDFCKMIIELNFHMAFVKSHWGILGNKFREFNEKKIREENQDDGDSNADSDESSD